MIDHATTFVGDQLAGAFDLEDADWDDVDHLIPHTVLGVPLKPLFDAGRLATGVFVGIGTFGIRQMGSFIDKAGDELAQGAVAGGILYFHGMALAADCLALDAAHRSCTDMDWTIRMCINATSEDAGRVLRSVVRALRKTLREKRRRAATFVTGAVEERLASVRNRASETMNATGERIAEGFQYAKHFSKGVAENVTNAMDNVTAERGRPPKAERADKTAAGSTGRAIGDQARAPENLAERNGSLASTDGDWVDSLWRTGLQRTGSRLKKMFSRDPIDPAENHS